MGTVDFTLALQPHLPPLPLSSKRQGRTNRHGACRCHQPWARGFFGWVCTRLHYRCPHRGVTRLPHVPRPLLPMEIEPLHPLGVQEGLIRGWCWQEWAVQGIPLSGGSQLSPVPWSPSVHGLGTQCHRAAVPGPAACASACAAFPWGRRLGKLLGEWHSWEISIRVLALQGVLGSRPGSGGVWVPSSGLGALRAFATLSQE